MDQTFSEDLRKAPCRVTAACSPEDCLAQGSVYGLPSFSIRDETCHVGRRVRGRLYSKFLCGAINWVTAPSAGCAVSLTANVRPSLDGMATTPIEISSRSLP